MKVTTHPLEKSEVKLAVELNEEEMNQYRQRAAVSLQTEIKVPGFRAGKIPMEVLVGHIGEQAFLGHVLELALEESYEEAVRQQKLRPVAYPKLSLLEQDPLKFEAVLPVVPEVTFKKELKELTVERKNQEVEEQEVQEVLENFVKRTVDWKDIPREAQKGDRVELDFDGKDMQGIPLEGTISKNHPVILGEGSLIPGFEEAIIGMKIGEEKNFELTFPSDYHSKAFQAKKVKFHVKVQRVEEGTPPEINDTLAQKVSGDEKKTLELLKGEIHEELKHQKEHAEMNRLENEFLKELLQIVEAELPEALVEREIDFLLQRIKEDSKKRQQNWDEYEKEMKEKGKDIRAELRKPATEQVLIRLALERLFELENPSITEDEIEKEIEHAVGHYPPEFQVTLKERYKKDSEGRELLKSGLRLKKLVAVHTKE